MLHKVNLYSLLALLLAFAACGDSDPTDTTGSTTGDDSGDGTAGQTETEVQAPSFECANTTPLAAGLNQGWQAGGQARDFYVDYPTADTATPVGVVFVFHGVGDTAENFRSFMGAGSVNADPAFPFIMVNVQGLRLMPALGPIKPGIEWDVFESVRGDDNLEAAIFEQVLACLGSTRAIDWRRIYIVGFSGGAIATNMLHARYPEIVGTVFSMSGMWFNDDVQKSYVDTGRIAVTLNWGPLADADGGTVAMTHGGLNDSYGSPQFELVGVEGGQVVSFEETSGPAANFLQANGRTVIDCAHSVGHNSHPRIPSSAILGFFKDHPLGKVSPYVAAGLPASLAPYCALNP